MTDTHDIDAIGRRLDNLVNDYTRVWRDHNAILARIAHTPKTPTYPRSSVRKVGKPRAGHRRNDPRG